MQTAAFFFAVALMETQTRDMKLVQILCVSIPPIGQCTVPLLQQGNRYQQEAGGSLQTL